MKQCPKCHHQRHYGSVCQCACRFGVALKSGTSDVSGGNGMPATMDERRREADERRAVRVPLEQQSGVTANHEAAVLRRLATKRKT